MSAAAQPDLRRTQRRLEGLLFGIPVPQPEIQHRTQRPGTVGRESAGVEADFADQVGIEDAHGAARGALRGEMVDIGDFDAVQIELVFRRAAAAHDQVVAIAHGRERHAGVRTYDTRHVAVGAGALFDLPHPDDLQPDGAFGRGAERRRHDRHGFELRGILLHFDFDERRGGRNEVFGRDDGLVPHGRGREAENTRPHPLEAEASQRIGRCAALFLPDGHYGGIGDRLPRQAVDHPAADGIGAALRPCRRGKAQRRNRRINSSVLPENIEPQTTSIQPARLVLSKNIPDSFLVVQKYKIKADSRRSGRQNSARSQFSPPSSHSNNKAISTKMQFRTLLIR